MPIESEDDRAALAARLKEAREYVGLSQEEVAQILKVPRTAISLMEKGDRKVDAIELKKLAQIYQRSVDHLTGVIEQAKPTPEVEHLARLARTASKLTAKDLDELNRFAQFLHSKAEPKKPQ